MELTKIADWLLLNGTLTKCPGLLHGKLGIAIFFFHYARYTGKTLFEEYAWDLIMAIQEQLHVNYRPDYEKGIAGTGVGINYLSYNNLIEIEEDLFEDFDKRMYRAVIHDPFPNYSRDEGLIGYGWYWLHRAKSQMSNECLSFITESIKNNRNDLSANEQQDIYLFLRAHTRELESNRIFPKLKPSLTLENMGLSGGYAGEGMYRLTALGAIETSWQQLL